MAIGSLGRELPETAIELPATGGDRPERFVDSVAIAQVTSWPWSHGKEAPTATYRIRVTEPRWIEHLSEGQRYVSNAYSMDGPFYA